MTNQQVIEQALTCFGDPARRSSYFDLYADHAVLHGYPGVGPGLKSIRGFYDTMFAGVPDAKVIPHEFLSLDDKVVVRFTMTGTHLGPLMGVPATGRPIQLPGITILRFENGKCVERWSVADFLAVLGQIGALPPPA